MFNQGENERRIPVIFIIIVNENLYRKSRYEMYVADIYFIKDWITVSFACVYKIFPFTESWLHRLKSENFQTFAHYI